MVKKKKKEEDDLSECCLRGHPQQECELGPGTEFKLTQCAIVYSSTKKLAYTELSNTTCQPVKLRLPACWSQYSWI